MRLTTVRKANDVIGLAEWQHHGGFLSPDVAEDRDSRSTRQALEKEWGRPNSGHQVPVHRYLADGPCAKLTTGQVKLSGCCRGKAFLPLSSCSHKRSVSSKGAEIVSLVYSAKLKAILLVLIFCS